MNGMLHVLWSISINAQQQRDRIPDTEVLERAESESIYALLKRSQLRLAGHVHRMDDDRIPKQLLYGELAEGKRSHGGQKKRYKDTLKATLKVTHHNSKPK